MILFLAVSGCRTYIYILNSNQRLKKVDNNQHFRNIFKKDDDEFK